MITIFFKEMRLPDDSYLSLLAGNSLAQEVMLNTYIISVLASLFVAVSSPIDRAMNFYRFVGTIMGLVMVFATFLFTSYLYRRGFYPNKSECVVWTEGDDQCYWREIPGEYYFSYFTVACCLIFSLYLLPFLMRPIDAIKNFKMHSKGLIAYWLTTPLFVSLFVLYSMCNLHDVSWGNRPTGNQLSADSVNQKALLLKV